MVEAGLKSISPEPQVRPHDELWGANIEAPQDICGNQQESDMKLVYIKSGAPVCIGDTVELTLGTEKVQAKVDSIVPPHNPASTGRVYVKWADDTYAPGYYPSVIGAHWIEREDREDPNE